MRNDLKCLFSVATLGLCLGAGELAQAQSSEEASPEIVVTGPSIPTQYPDIAPSVSVFPDRGGIPLGAQEFHPHRAVCL